MVNIDDIFSVVALFILFRETVEASIVCGVLLQFLNRSKPKLKRSVWWGVAAGVAVSILFGIIFVVIFYVAKNNLFSNKNRDLFKGIISYVAGTLIIFLGFAMFRFMGWEEKWKRRLEVAAAKRMSEVAKTNAARDKAAGLDPLALDNGKEASLSSDSTSDKDSATNKPLQPKESAMVSGVAALSSSPSKDRLERVSSSSANAVALTPVQSQTDKDMEEALAVVEAGGQPLDMSEPSREEFWSIWVLVFTTVTREGIETVVFLGGVGQAKASAFPLPGFVGIVAGVLVGMFLYYTGKQVKDLKWFLIISGVIILFLGIGQIMIGTDAMMRAGMFGECSIWVDERPWYMQPVYDISPCCNDTTNRFLSLMRALFGYQDKPTMIELTVYFGMWAVIIVAIVVHYRRGSLFDADFKYKREQAKLAREAQEAEALGFPSPLALTAGDNDGSLAIKAGAAAQNVVVLVGSQNQARPRTWYQALRLGRGRERATPLSS